MEKVLTQYSDRLLSFVLNSLLNTLPTPNNLRLWRSAKNLSCGLCGKSDSVTFGHIMGGCPWVLNVENKTSQMKTDTHGGIIMCSESCAMQSFTKYNSAMQTITKILFQAFNLWKKRLLPQQSTQLKHKAKGKLSTEILQEQMIGQFSSNFQNWKHSQ